MNRFGQAISGCFSVKLGVREADFTFVLKNVHPGVALRDRIDGFHRKGTRAVQNSIQNPQADDEKDGKRQGKNAADNPEDFRFADGHT